MMHYPDEAVMEEEAHEGGAHGGVLHDDRLGDVAHRGLGLRARRAVEAVHQRRPSHGRLCAQRGSHEHDEEHNGQVACRHRHG